VDQQSASIQGSKNTPRSRARTTSFAWGLNRFRVCKIHACFARSKDQNAPRLPLTIVIVICGGCLLVSRRQTKTDWPVSRFKFYAWNCRDGITCSPAQRTRYLVVRILAVELLTDFNNNLSFIDFYIGWTD
jgi:hypothetical protein